MSKLLAPAPHTEQGMSVGQVLAVAVQTMTSSVGYGRQIAALESSVHTRSQADLFAGIIDVQAEAHAALLSGCSFLTSRFEEWLDAASSHQPEFLSVDPLDYVSINADPSWLGLSPDDCDRLGLHFLSLAATSLEALDMDRLNESTHARDYGWFSAAVLTCTRFYERDPAGSPTGGEILKNILLNAKDLNRMADLDVDHLYRGVVTVISSTVISSTVTSATVA